MPFQVGIQITKRVSFRLVQQEFHNVYHYRLETATTAPDEALIDAIVAIERDLHSTDVSFVRAAAWSSGGSPTQNNMRFQKNLTGTGNQSVSTTMDRERAVLIRWPAGNDIRGRKVYLRKFFHCCGNFAGHIFTNDELKQIAAIPDAERAIMATSANRLKTIHADLWRLCSPKGRVREELPGAECHKFLEHHQLGDMWRG